MFASPNDYSSNFNAPAIWTSLNSVSPDSVYFGLNNLYDDDVIAFYKQFDSWNNIGMPTFGDTLNVDLTTNHFSSHQLYTTITGPNANQNHIIMIRKKLSINDTLLRDLQKLKKGIISDSLFNLGYNLIVIF